MKIILQRVNEAEVVINNSEKRRISKGLLILSAFSNDDDESKVKWVCNKILNMRIFADSESKMNLSVQDIKGDLLLISNFTLYGDPIKGNRPNFSAAAKPEIAIPLYENMISELKKSSLKVETGTFGADMNISLVNNGPVTIILEK